MTALNEHYVLKVTGEHGLIFKTKHYDHNYLDKIANALMDQQDTHFTSYEIHTSDHSNDEMTVCEDLIHFQSKEFR